VIRALIHSGHIDCLHSFGDLATTRAHAVRALDELTANDCRLEVWIDHAVAPTNFGADIMRGYGDVASAAAYHADLSLRYGLKYVWRGRVTSVIGQEVPRSLVGLFSPAHPMASTLTITKEATKAMVGLRGNPKYAPHARNSLTFHATLRDGQSVTEFLRSNPHFAGPSGGDTATGVAEVLTDRFLRVLAARGGFCILYTHLGKVLNPAEPFGPATRAAFRRLAAHVSDGSVMVTTTRRLLGYQTTVRSASVCANRAENATWVAVTVPNAVTPSDLQGLTIHVPNADEVRLTVNGREMTGLLHKNPADSTGRLSVSLPWQRLEFPHDL